MALQEDNHSVEMVLLTLAWYHLAEHIKKSLILIFYEDSFFQQVSVSYH